VRSAAAAIGWALGRRHRWGLAATGLYLVSLAALRIAKLGSRAAAVFSEEWHFALAVTVPSSLVFMYFLAVFSFGLDGDLAGRRSMFPARMFTLPVTNGALAGWPMLYGTTAVAGLWAATRLLGLGMWPADLRLPIVWPALFAAVILAWTQALTWMPYGLRGMRVVVAVLLMILIDVVVIPAHHYGVSELVMIALLAPLLPAAYLTARVAVARARRGEVPAWGRLFRLGGGALRPRRGNDFRSSTRALAWLEWRRYGRSLPLLVAILLPFELSLLFLFREAPVLVAETVVSALLTPPFLAAFVAATVARSYPEARDAYELTPFVAARPVSSPALLAAKLTATMRSALAAWLLVLVALPLALRLSKTWALVVDAALQVAEVLGTRRAVALALLVLAGLVAETWKQLVQGLAIGMSGRPWLVKGSVFGGLVLLALAVPLGLWAIGSRQAIATVLQALPWILAALVAAKIAGAGWVAARLVEGRVLGDRTLVASAAAWAVAVFALYAILVWLLPTIVFPRHVLALVAILAVPLVRLSAAPLAVDWNRHR
jgi:hypothetical protein